MKQNVRRKYITLMCNFVCGVHRWINRSVYRYNSGRWSSGESDSGRGVDGGGGICEARPRKIRFPRSIWFENRRGKMETVNAITINWKKHTEFYYNCTKCFFLHRRIHASKDWRIFESRSGGDSGEHFSRMQKSSN